MDSRIRFALLSLIPVLCLSAARSFALRDRGLRSVSSSSAVIGLRVKDFINPLLRAFAHGILYQPVLERVEADHYQPSSGLQQPRCGLEQRLDLPQLSIHINSERLKGPRRRMQKMPGSLCFIAGAAADTIPAKLSPSS